MKRWLFFVGLALAVLILNWGYVGRAAAGGDFQGINLGETQKTVGEKLSSLEKNGSIKRIDPNRFTCQFLGKNIACQMSYFQEKLYFINVVFEKMPNICDGKDKC